MILSRTPFRITLGGGGTDLPGFYGKHGGHVLALGIDRYMYVVLNIPYADRKVRLHYTKSEMVDHIDDLEHELAREALRAHGIWDAIEIASVADLPAGTGLGSSSSYLVGLLTVIRAYLSHFGSAEELAAEACRIELEVLKKPIGKQDQYMAAAGGLTELSIDTNGNVTLDRIPLSSYAIAELIANTHLYYTNVNRSTTAILGQQVKKLDAGPGAVEENLLRIAAIGYEITKAVRAADFDEFGLLMHEHWLAKKELSDGAATVPIVERFYEHLRSEYGVLGGKVAGAGGGGFLMLYCSKNGRRLTEFMESQGMPRLHYGPEFEGSRVVANLQASRSISYHVSSKPLPGAAQELAARAMRRNTVNQMAPEQARL